ncbi:MAG: DUF1501 domain-containing protein [Planctomycetes bacterium]|nr:DUF1501 domain-containing protein [Planctomycetota bacterium]
MTTHQGTRPPRSVGRRDVLRAGFLGLGGLCLGDLLRLRAAGDKHGEQTACVLVWLGGGPSHLDTYDLKPDAPAEYRGPYRPIRTRVPGLDVCQLLPRHARIAHRFALVRSCTHGFAGHWDGAQHVLTGWPAVLTGGGTPTSVFPEIGAVVKKVRPQGRGGLPTYVTISHRIDFVGPAYLGKGYEPFVAVGDPSAPDYRVPNLGLPADACARLEERRSLRRAFDGFRRDIDRSGTMEALDDFDREAMQLLTSRETQRAFDISLGNPRERDRYGRCNAGQRLFLVRRLVEAGVGFVTVELSNYREAGVDGGWDDHAGGCNIFDRMNRRLPVYDQALCTFLEDLYDRGLDKQVLVVVLGEFGRTPQINTKDGKPGREHWPAAMSVLFSGGGLRVGQVIGSTDARGERPKTRPVRPVDVLATIYQFLGIDTKQQFRDTTGRPLAILPEGEPIQELL